MTEDENPDTSLRERIAAAQNSDKELVADKFTRAETTGWRYGFRLASEFVSAILVGGGIGWLLDQWLATMPWLLLICLGFGFAAGVLNVIRATKAIAELANDNEEGAKALKDEE